MTDIVKDVFKSISVQFLQTEDYIICCLLLHQSVCTATFPWYFTCQELLHSCLVKVMFYTISCLVVALSGASVCMHKISHSKGLEKIAAHGILVASINFSDICFSVSFFVLWVADLTYAEAFHAFASSWKASFPSFFTFAVFLLCDLNSPLLASFLSVSRLMIVKHPVDTNYKVAKFVKHRILVIYMSTLLGTAVVTLIVSKVQNCVPTALCSPYIDPENSIIVQRLTWFTLIWQCSLLLSIVIVCVQMLVHFEKSTLDVRNATTRKQSKTPILVQLAVVVSSCVLCWVPSRLIFAVCLAKARYPTELPLWALIAVTPINSLVNPIVFIATASRKLINS